MGSFTTMFSTPPLMEEKYLGDIKVIQEHAESISYRKSNTNFISDNSFILNDNVFVSLKNLPILPVDIK